MIRSFIESSIVTIFEKLHIKLNENKIKEYAQFIMFVLIGITNSIISYVLNILILIALKPYKLSWDYIVANIVQFIISVLWSYYWNNKLVFKLEEGQDRNKWYTLLKTYLTYGFTGLILTNLLSYVWIDLLGISKYISPIITIVICLPINYIINKKWAFSAKKNSHNNHNKQK